MRGGWRPWADDNVIYTDQTMYNAESQIIGNTKRNGNQIKRRISEYIEEKRLTLSGKTMESYVSKLRIFVLWLEKTDRAATYLHKISPEIINEFAMFLINVRKLDRLTVDKYKQNLSQFFRWLMDKNIVERNPVLKMPLPPKTKDYAARPISDNDLDKILREIKKADPQLFLACMFEYFLCCRPGKELRLLRIEDINIFSRTVHISEENGKTGARSITMPETLISICNEYNLFEYNAGCYVFGSKGKPSMVALGKNYFNRRFRYFRELLGMSSSYKFYSLKHTAAGKLLESGATIVEVKNHLGHRDFESTIHYIKRHFGERSEKVANFKPDFLKNL